MGDAQRLPVQIAYPGTTSACANSISLGAEGEAVLSAHKTLIEDNFYQEVQKQSSFSLVDNQDYVYV